MRHVKEPEMISTRALSSSDQEPIYQAAQERIKSRERRRVLLMNDLRNRFNIFATICPLFASVVSLERRNRNKGGNHTISVSLSF